MCNPSANLSGFKWWAQPRSPPLPLSPGPDSPLEPGGTLKADVPLHFPVRGCSQPAVGESLFRSNSDHETLPPKATWGSTSHSESPQGHSWSHTIWLPVTPLIPLIDCLPLIGSFCPTRAARCPRSCGNWQACCDLRAFVPPHPPPHPDIDTYSCLSHTLCHPYTISFFPLHLSLMLRWVTVYIPITISL